VNRQGLYSLPETNKNINNKSRYKNTVEKIGDPVGLDVKLLFLLGRRVGNKTLAIESKRFVVYRFGVVLTVVVAQMQFYYNSINNVKCNERYEA
jgi:hypothetical protein